MTFRFSRIVSWTNSGSISITPLHFFLFFPSSVHSLLFREYSLPDLRVNWELMPGRRHLHQFYGWSSGWVYSTCICKTMQFTVELISTTCPSSAVSWIPQQNVHINHTTKANPDYEAAYSSRVKFIFRHSWNRFVNVLKPSVTIDTMNSWESK